MSAAFLHRERLRCRPVRQPVRRRPFAVPTAAKLVYVDAQQDLPRVRLLATVAPHPGPGHVQPRERLLHQIVAWSQLPHIMYAALRRYARLAATNSTNSASRSTRLTKHPSSRAGAGQGSLACPGHRRLTP